MVQRVTPQLVNRFIIVPNLRLDFWLIRVHRRWTTRQSLLLEHLCLLFGIWRCMHQMWIQRMQKTISRTVRYRSWSFKTTWDDGKGWGKRRAHDTDLLPRTWWSDERVYSDPHTKRNKLWTTSPSQRKKQLQESTYFLKYWTRNKRRKVADQKRNWQLGSRLRTMKDGCKIVADLLIL